MGFTALHKARARNAAKIIRAGLYADNPQAGIELIRHWPKTGIRQGIIAGYWPIGTEINIIPLLSALAGAGHKLCLPVISRPHHALQFREYQPGEKLTPGPHSTRQPDKTKNILLPDIVFVPLLAYARDGHRLGYGGGYYDRTLAELRKKGQVFACGIGFSGQQVPGLPAGELDERLDGLLNEKEFIRF